MQIDVVTRILNLGRKHLVVDRSSQSTDVIVVSFGVVMFSGSGGAVFLEAASSVAE